MTISTTAFNPFDIIDADDVSDYLAEVWADDDPDIFIMAICHLVRHICVAEVANKAGLNRESLYKTLNGQRLPWWATVHKLMRAMDIQLIPVIQKAS